MQSYYIFLPKANLIEIIIDNTIKLCIAHSEKQLSEFLILSKLLLRTIETIKHGTASKSFDAYTHKNNNK